MDLVDFGTFHCDMMVSCSVHGDILVNEPVIEGGILPKLPMPCVILIISNNGALIQMIIQ